MKHEKTGRFFHANVLRFHNEDVGVFASSEEEAKSKIIALYEEKGMEVLSVLFLKKTEESCDKKIEVPTTEHSTPK